MKQLQVLLTSMLIGLLVALVCFVYGPIELFPELPRELIPRACVDAGLIAFAFALILIGPRALVRRTD